MLKKISLIILAAGLVMPFSQAFGTDVSGDVWGDWTADNSPYNVVGSIRVPPDSSLIIEAGVEVIFCTQCSLSVTDNALIQANGVEGDSVYFIGGMGLRFNETSAGSCLNFTRIYYVRGYRNGAILAVNSTLAINNCQIDRNSPTHSYDLKGGGIAGIGSYIEINDSRISFNRCVSPTDFPWPNCRGAGIYFLNSTAVICRTIFDNNYTEGAFGFGYGGGIYSENSNIAITNSTFTKNTSRMVQEIPPYYPSHYYGSGIYAENSTAELLNCIVFGNTGSDVYGDSLSIQYSDIGDTIPGDGNIYSDPMFADSTNNDFHLLFGSPCINTGDPNSPLDPDSTRADMGALFYDFRTGIDEPISLPDEFVLHQNYPNPFNAQTTISYELPKPSNVSIEIFDITGRQVSSLFAGYQDPGSYSIVWDAGEEVSGVYFYRLRAENISEIKRCVIIK